jgi:hypothetical protein
VRLGLRGLARAIAGAAGTCLVAAAVGAAAMAVGFGAVATAVDRGDSWTVTVGPASRQLFPGTEATMSYDVRNATSGSLRLQGTTASIHPTGAGDACRAEWFRISSNTVPTDVDVAPGETVHGSLVLRFDDAPASQDACQNIDLQVVVTAT